MFSHNLQFVLGLTSGGGTLDAIKTGQNFCAYAADVSLPTAALWCISKGQSRNQELLWST